MHDIEVVQALRKDLKAIVRGQETACDFVIAALLAGGHVLIEGLPGMGKTLMVRALAHLVSVDFRRVQCTPDLMPADVIGTTLISGLDAKMAFRPGPVFTRFLMADELNRANPRTQAALLEAMQEQQVTVDGTSHPLDELFFCIATQNPLELEGTYPLPEAQLDRFLFKIRLGYPDREEESELLSWYAAGRGLLQYPLEGHQPILDGEQLRGLRKNLLQVVVKENTRSYILDFVRESRMHKDVLSGASPRAGIALLSASRAWAWIEGRDFVIPEDVKFVSQAVLQHRIRLQPEAELAGVSPEQLISALGSSIQVPV